MQATLSGQLIPKLCTIPKFHFSVQMHDMHEKAWH